MFDLLVIALLCLFYAKGKRAIIAYENREQRWRDADAPKRERIVRQECAWRVFGRLVGAAGLAIGVFTVASAGQAVLWALITVRVVRPIRSEMREACGYRSTGSDDEPPYSW